MKERKKEGSRDATDFANQEVSFEGQPVADGGIIPVGSKANHPGRPLNFGTVVNYSARADLGIARLSLCSASDLLLWCRFFLILAGRLLDGGVDCRLMPKQGVVNLNNPLPFVGIVAVFHEKARAVLFLLSHQWLFANGNKKLKPVWRGGRHAGSFLPIPQRLPPSWPWVARRSSRPLQLATSF